MLDRLLQLGAAAASVSAILVAGVFFAFSNFVMPALFRLPGVQGAEAMGMINVTVVNPGFMVPLFGTGLVGLALTIAAIAFDTRLSGGLCLAATAVYLVGCIGVTLAFNVPLNDALAVSLRSGPSTVSYWHAYVSGWTWWNSVRTVAACAAGALYALALRAA